MMSFCIRYISLNAILTALFIRQCYTDYFVSLFVFWYFFYRYEREYDWYKIPLCGVSFIVSIFLYRFFDDTIFDIFVELDIDRFYTFIGGGVAYILAILHLFIFFFKKVEYNRANDI